jgi:hypothetical protein
MKFIQKPSLLKEKSIKICKHFYTIGDYNKYLNTIRGIIGRCNGYFRR